MSEQGTPDELLEALVLLEALLLEDDAVDELLLEALLLEDPPPDELLVEELDAVVAAPPEPPEPPQPRQGPSPVPSALQTCTPDLPARQAQAT